MFSDPSVQPPASPTAQATGPANTQVIDTTGAALKNLYGHIAGMGAERVARDTNPGTSSGSSDGTQGSETDSAQSVLPQDAVDPKTLETYQAEVKVASGASLRGGRHPSVYKTYARYARALDKLASGSNPVLRPLIAQAAADIRQMARILDDNQYRPRSGGDTFGAGILEMLNERGRLLIPAFSKNHAMLAEIEAHDGGYRVRIYNSGEGLTTHHAQQGKKYATFVEYQVASLSSADLGHLLDLQRQGQPSPSVAEDVYKWAAGLKGANKRHPPAGEVTWQTSQKAGDCTLESLNAWLRDSVARSVRQNPQLRPHDGLAQKMYREMKVSYLAQVRKDYLRRFGSSPDMAPYLEAIRLRVDRAEMASRLDQANPEASDSVGYLKDQFQLYTQVYDLAISGRKGTHIRYHGRHINTVLDEASSGSDALRFTDRGPSGISFAYNKTDGSVSIRDPRSDNLLVEIKPEFDGEGQLKVLDISASDVDLSFHRETIFHLSANELAGNEQLRGSINSQDLEKLASKGRDFYIEVQHAATGQNDRNDGRYTSNDKDISIFAFNKDKSTVTQYLNIDGGSSIDFEHPIQPDAGKNSPSPAARPTPVDPALQAKVDEWLATQTAPANDLNDLNEVFSSEAEPAKRDIEAIQSLKTAMAGQTELGPLSTEFPDGSTRLTALRRVADGSLQVIDITTPADQATLKVVIQTLDAQGQLLQAQGSVASGISPQTLLDQVLATPQAQLPTGVETQDWQERRITPGAAAGEYTITESLPQADGSVASATTQTKTLASAELSTGPLAPIAQEVAIPPEDAASFALDGQGSPVEAITTTTPVSGTDGNTLNIIETRYLQTQADGSLKALVRRQLGTERIEWISQTLSADGKNLHEITRIAGSAARAERTASMAPDGALTETLVEQADPNTLQDPDQAVLRTDRTTRQQADGIVEVDEEIRSGNSMANASPGGHPERIEQRHAESRQETGADGVRRTTTSSTSRIVEDGRATSTRGETVVAQRGTILAVESTATEVTTADNLTLRSETREGQTVESVKVGDAYVEASQAPTTPALKQALAGLDLAQNAVLADLAAQHGLDAVAPLLGKPAELSTDLTQRKTQLQGWLDARASGSLSRVFSGGALNAGNAAFAIYQGVVGIHALQDAIKAGSTYGIALGSTGVAAGAAQVAELGIRGVGLMSSSSRAVASLSKMSTVAGRLAFRLGLVAMGLGVGSLADAIRSGDTKAIVSNAVGLGGGLAAMALGSVIGGALGMGVGLVLGGLVFGFVELFNKLFNPGTKISGVNPISTLTPTERNEALAHATLLLDHWDDLGGDLSRNRLKELCEQAPSEDLKAAAHYFVGHDILIDWMDAANGGGTDFEWRDAKYDGNISRSDLARFIGYLAVPPEIYRTLPPPSQDARLWAVGILDPDTHDAVVDAFGKDGQGQGSGDGIGALAEYANIASGRFDDQTWWLLKSQHPGESDEQIGLRRDRLKKACAYLATYPSERRYIDTHQQPDREDGKLASSDFASVRADHQPRIDELLANYPDGLPSFNDSADALRSLGSNNPALWRPGRFGQANPQQPQSYYRVLLDNFSAIDENGNGELDWTEMAHARERGLQAQQYSLYYALDHVMRNGADLFADRGEGTRLSLRKADLSLKAGQDPIDPADMELLPPQSWSNRCIEAATLSQFIEVNSKGSDRLEIDDLTRLSAGYWQGADNTEITPPPAVRQAALYFIQNPAELGALTRVEQSEDGPQTTVLLADLKAAGANQPPQSEPLAPQAASEQASASRFGPQGASLAQQSSYWRSLEQSFDAIEASPLTQAAADGLATQDDVKAAQAQALQNGQWEAYHALGWLLSTWSLHADASNLVSKEAVTAQAAKALLRLHREDLDKADGAQDGSISLAGLEQTRAQWEQAGNHQDAQSMAWLAADYGTRIEHLGTSLDVDEGQRRNDHPADDLISIDGDIRKQLADYPLSPEDKSALQTFLDNPTLITHYGDEDDPVVNTQAFKDLLGQHLEWFEPRSSLSTPPPAEDDGDSGMGLDL